MRKLKKNQRDCVDRSSKGRSGALTIEFAIVAPLIFLLFFGGLELAAVNFVRHTAGNAAYEGCRALMLPGGATQDAIDESTRLMNQLGYSNGVNVIANKDATKATVTIEVPARLYSFGLVRFTGNTTIRQTCSLTLEVP
ncbi:MAG: pilus assembly protein [Planctomycetaceae bacterium]|nr:pilus assembly protein [Planctomycetaceae bacterium]